MKSSHLERYVIAPVLRLLTERSGLPLNSPVAVKLLLATAATETMMGQYLHQEPGPARGIYQMEPATISWTVSQVSIRWPAIATEMAGLVPLGVIKTTVEGGLHYATALARMRYYLVPEPLPPGTSAQDLWPYYKKHWNTEAGKATEVKFIRDFQRYVR